MFMHYTMTHMSGGVLQLQLHRLVSSGPPRVDVGLFMMHWGCTEDDDGPHVKEFAINLILFPVNPEVSVPFSQIFVLN